MSIFGSVPTFDYKSDEWPVHVAQLNNFFVANGINANTDKDGSKMRAILLNCMSQDSYRLVRDLLLPLQPETTTYQVILDTLQAHFQPKKCLFAERQNFYSAKKEAHETLSYYAARLRGLASGCNFGKSLEMCLSDRFVLGLDSAVVREKLFREDPTDLKLSKALELAVAVEGAQRVVRGAERPLLYAAARRPRDQRDQRAGAGGASGARCPVCGGKSHLASDCGFRHLSCDICGQKGHLKRVCKNKNRRNVKQNNYLGDGSENSDDTCDNDCSPVNSIRCTDAKPMIVEVRVGDVTLGMEVDSGSAVSALPEGVWRKYFSRAALGESDKTLRTYSGALLKPIGVCDLQVTYNDATHDISFYVVSNGPVALLGRDFMTKFNLGLVSLNFCTNNKDESVLKKYDSLFSGKLGEFNRYKLSLRLKDGSVPKFRRARSVPFAMRDKVSVELDRLVSAGILKPVSYSKYASPIVAVLKKNNEVRICGDYSGTINKDLKIDSYPLPKVNELCTALHGCRYYTKLDLSNSYNQFVLDDESQEYTCINTHKGLFVYTRLVFGLANAPALFQRAMVQLLQGIEGVECFLDDVLIAAPTLQQHWERVDEVLGRLRDAGLMLQRTKCSFCQEKVEYLGFVIDRDGMHKSPDKVNAIMNLKSPANVKELKSFLGIINFYRNFIPNASIQLEPLHSLLRKEQKWEWSERHQKAFEAVKRELGSERTLAHFDPRHQLVLTVDAAPGGLGAVLAVRYANGDERPLGYASRALTKSERGYSQIQKEATAIIFDIKKYLVQ